MVDKEGNGGRVAVIVVSCDGDSMSTLVGEEHLESSTGVSGPSVSIPVRAVQ